MEERKKRIQSIKDTCIKHSCVLKMSDKNLSDLISYIEYDILKLENISNRKIQHDLVEINSLVSSVNFSEVFLHSHEFRVFLLCMIRNRQAWLLWLCYQLSLIENSCVRSFDQRQRQLVEHVLIPLSNYLGIGYFKSLFEEHYFRHAQPDIYIYMQKQLQVQTEDRVGFMNRIKSKLENIFCVEGNQSCKVSARTKTLLGIYKKMNRKSIRATEVFDHVAFRVIVTDVSECYQTLSIIHKYFDCVSGEFNDYIIEPKSNGYQSLHTSVTDKDSGVAFEIQIRTDEMHQHAELGVAAHWLYKERQDSSAKWLNKMLMWQPMGDDKTVEDIFEGDKVFVLTPRGDILSLPKGSSGIDAAYAVHTDLGHTIKSLIVNDRIRPITHTLNTGDKIKIICSNHSTPSLDWLSHPISVKSSKAIRCIRKWFYHEMHKDATKDRSENEILSVKCTRNEIPNESHQVGSQFVLSVEGLGHWVYDVAKCCQPEKSDTIVVKVSKKRGLRVHKKNCPELNQLTRVYDAEWN